MSAPVTPAPFEARNLAEVRQQLSLARRERLERMQSALAGLTCEHYTLCVAARDLQFSLHTLMGQRFAGHMIEACEPAVGLPSNDAEAPSMLQRLFRRSGSQRAAPMERRVSYLSLFSKPDTLAAQLEGVIEDL